MVISILTVVAMAVPELTMAVFLLLIFVQTGESVTSSLSIISYCYNHDKVYQVNELLYRTAAAVAVLTIYLSLVI